MSHAYSPESPVQASGAPEGPVAPQEAEIEPEGHTAVTIGHPRRDHREGEREHMNSRPGAGVFIHHPHHCKTHHLNAGSDLWSLGTVWQCECGNRYIRGKWFGRIRRTLDLQRDTDKGA